MALRSGATAGSGSGSGSNFKVSGFSLGRHAMSSSSGDFQLSDVEPSVIGINILIISISSMQFQTFSNNFVEWGYVNSTKKL